MRETTTSQDARSPGSWTSQEGPPEPRREHHPCPQTSSSERRDFGCFRPHSMWSFSKAAPRDAPGSPRTGASSEGGQGPAASPPRIRAFPAARAAACDLPARPQGWARVCGRGSPWPGPLGPDHPHKAETHRAEGRLGVGTTCPHLHLVNPRPGGDKDKSGHSRPCRLPRHLTKLKVLWSQEAASSHHPPTSQERPHLWGHRPARGQDDGVGKQRV